MGAVAALTVGGIGVAFFIGSPILTDSNVVTENAPGQLDAADAEAEDPNVCGVVNGFTVTHINEPTDCEAALAITDAYTTAVQSPDARAELGSGLFWSSDGWVCSRGYDETVITANSHGLICQRGATKISLVS